MSGIVRSDARYVVEFEGLGFYAADQKNQYHWQFTHDINHALEYKTLKGATDRGITGVGLAQNKVIRDDDLLAKAGSQLRYRVHAIQKIISSNADEWMSYVDIKAKRNQEKLEKHGPPETITLASLMSAQ